MHDIPSPSPQAETRLRRQRLLAFLGMAAAMLIFGANFVISRHAVLNGLTAHDLLALRFATAGLILLPSFLAGGAALCGGLGWGRGLLLATMSGLPMSYLLLTGLTLAPAAHGATIGPGLVTTIGILGSVWMFGTRLTATLAAGVAAVLAGLACLALAGTQSATPGMLLGDLCFVGTGLIWGFYPLMIQRWKIDGLQATAVVSVLSMVYLPFYAAFFFRGFDYAPWWVFVLHAVNQGVLNVVLGLWIWAWAARVLGAGVVGRFPPTIPVIGTLLAIPTLGEIPGPLQLVGIALIVSGLGLATLRRAPSPQARQPHQAEVPEHTDEQAEP